MGILDEIKIITTSGWEDYELLDSGDGRRLEKFGDFILDRPDPQAIWKKSDAGIWDKASAIFERSGGDKGDWVKKVTIDEKWPIQYKNLKFWVKLTPFKHTGIFPEQSPQWDFIADTIEKAGREVNMLNLFAYTGAATVAAAKKGARVTHVDASRPAVTWANENRELNGLADAPVRWIIDDALEFTKKEAKRGVKYDAIVLDPPVYGHSPNGSAWEFDKQFPELMENIRKVISSDPLFVLVNAYALSMSSISLKNILESYLGDLGGNFENGELSIKEKSGERLLSTGIWAKWVK